ncbi:hypothetical protein SAMN04488245_10160 [Alloyangia pacifica]|uniref:Uncharacterized protein n=1 Tax=Alloyangia pacifica TaxID=311180 RepID=A0A1I6QH48_9RHOB|nr:hypothetical protein SAMN04488245_10160 [Alloyangia pacifica]SFS51630.1 hypothetical protein SAMN04488050_10261 [Alloyangia pacifica]
MRGRLRPGPVGSRLPGKCVGAWAEHRGGHQYHQQQPAGRCASRRPLRRAERAKIGQLPVMEHLDLVQFRR